MAGIRFRLHNFIPQRALHYVNKKIREIGANILINTIHHEIHWFNSFVDLGVPTFFINKNYELHSQQKTVLRSQSSNHLKVLTPIKYKKTYINQKAIGYPIREGFETIATIDDKEKVRAKYGIYKGESLAIVQMGSLAMGLEIEITKLVKGVKKLKHRTHFLFLCAKNKKVIDLIETIKRTLDSDSNINLHPLGIQTDKELGLLYQTADVVIGKPGGVITAEISATGAYLLALKPLPWEIPNLLYLIERKQGIEIRDISEIIGFLNGLKQNNVKLSKPKVVDWKENLVDLVDKIEPNETTHDFKVKNPFSHRKIVNFYNRYLKPIFSYVSKFFRFLRYLFKILYKSLFDQSRISETLSVKIKRLKTIWKYI